MGRLLATSSVAVKRNELVMLMLVSGHAGRIKKPGFHSLDRLINPSISSRVSPVFR